MLMLLLAAAAGLLYCIGPLARLDHIQHARADSRIDLSTRLTGNSTRPSRYTPLGRIRFA